MGSNQEETRIDKGEKSELITSRSGRKDEKINYDDLNLTVLTENDFYYYNAEMIRAIDGDTVEFLIDTGFDNSTTKKVRILGIDTPELYSKKHTEAIAARDFVRDEIGLHAQGVSLLTYKTDSFGRWLADVLLWYGEVDENGSKVFVDLGDLLIKKGYAEPYHG